MNKLQFIRPEQLEESVVCEIVSFLDKEDMAHPFQYPQWARSEDGNFPAGWLFCAYRQDLQIKWFASCGILYPAGRLLSPLRALIMTRGPVCGDPNVWDAALQALVSHAKSEGFTYVEASPELVPSRMPDIVRIFRENGWQSRTGARTSLRLDLNKTEEQLVCGFRKTTRHEILRAERIGIKIEKSNSNSDISDFLTVYREMAVRKNFFTDALGHVRSIIRWLSVEPQRGILLLASHQSNILGGAVVFKAGKRCWYVWGATQRYDKASVGHLLQWKAIQWAKSQGCAEYDFGGYTVNATSGPALFKKGFGGEVVHFLESQRAVVNTRRNRVLELLSRQQ